MTPVVRLMALWLAVCWLPLTIHCQLASLPGCDEMSFCCENHCGCSGSDDCQSAVCKVIETGNFVVKRDVLSAPAASCVPLDGWQPVAVRRQVLPAAILSEATGAPPGWHRVWQFVFRAAPAPRAPSAAC